MKRRVHMIKPDWIEREQEWRKHAEALTKRITDMEQERIDSDASWRRLRDSQNEQIEGLQADLAFQKALIARLPVEGRETIVRQLRIELGLDVKPS